jgi:hypothetical protein
MWPVSQSDVNMGTIKMTLLYECRVFSGNFCRNDLRLLESPKLQQNGYIFVIVIS